MKYSRKNRWVRPGILGRKLLVLLIILPATGVAQDQLMPGETVRDRHRPELDPSGLPVGTFRLLSTLDVGGTYDSNIFAQARDEIEDWILYAAPRFELGSDWVRHALEMTADAEIVRFGDFSSEDVENYGLTARLTLDLTTHNRIRFSGRTAREHEERTSPDDAGGFTPTPIDRDQLIGEYAYAGERRLRLRLRGMAETLDFDDIPGPDGIVNNDDRDRTVEEFDLRVGFEINEGLEAALVASTDTRDYDLDPDDPRLNRSSVGVFYGIGLSGTITRVVFADVVIGNTSRDYDDPSLRKVDSLWYDGRIVWNPSDLTSLTLRTTRDIRETTVGTASGYVASRFELRADHELRRNLLIYASAAFGDNDFQGLDRNDDVQGFDLGAQYMLNRYLQVEIDLRSRAREAEQAVWAFDDFDKNTVSITVRMQF